MKWQHKLNCPKPDEDFHDLFARARMLEEHEKLYAASAVGRTDAKKASTVGTRRPTQDRRLEKQEQPSDPLPRHSENITKPEPRQCYRCKQSGHVCRDCPLKPESPGRTPAVNSGVTATSCTSEHPSQLTEHQLEELLAGKRLDHERELLEDSQTSVVTALEEQTEAVGKLLYMQVEVEGVPVDAMLDTGSQSTIISRSTLHALNRKPQQEGKKLYLLWNYPQHDCMERTDLRVDVSTNSRPRLSLLRSLFFC